MPVRPPVIRECSGDRSAQFVRKPLMRLISGRSHLNEEDAASEANDRDACRDDAKKSACHCDAAFLKLFNSSSDLITISSMERGTLLDVNDSFLRVTGYHRDSVVGHTELELRSEEHTSELQ